METGAIVITVAGVGATRSISYRAQRNQLIQSHLQHNQWHGSCFGMHPEAFYRPLWEPSSRAEGAAGAAEPSKTVIEVTSDTEIPLIRLWGFQRRRGGAGVTSLRSPCWQRSESDPGQQLESDPPPAGLMIVEV